MKLLIAGLDGATWDVLDPLLATGRLPTLSRLISQGSKHTLTSTIPPISSAAWVTMMSGLNPGKHGIFDFRNLDLHRYTAHDETLANANSYIVPTLFDYLSYAQLRLVAYGVPMTYPPRPINGIMVSGYPTPDHRQAYTYPPEISRRLGKLYTHSPDQIGAARPEVQFAIYREYMRSMTDNLLQLYDANTDILMFVNGATDGAQHRFFKYVAPSFPGVSRDERDRYHSLLAQIMVEADIQLGRLLDNLPPDTNVLVISDHGGMPRPVRAFNINAWLHQEGWLVSLEGTLASGQQKGQKLVEWAKQTLPVTEWVKKHFPNRLKQQIIQLRDGLGNIDWSRTYAYRVKMSHPIEGVHLNVSRRQPEGQVRAKEYTVLREKIMTRLEKRPEIQRVWRREEVYTGPYLERAPDIIVQLNEQYDGGTDLDQVVTDIPAGWLQRISGYHTLNGILVASGPAFSRIDNNQCITTPNLRDITPTVLHLLELPVPQEMDGEVLTDLFTTSRPVVYGESLPDREAFTTQALSIEEEAGIVDALRDLGYIE